MIFAIDYIKKSKGPNLGLSVAIEELTKAWLRTSQQNPLVCRAADQASGAEFLDLAQNQNIDVEQRCVVLNAQDPAQSLARLDTLFIPDPAMANAAWQRNTTCRPALCGLVHTLSGERVAQALLDLSLAPTNKSDALICPSRSIRDAVQKMWETQASYLNKRLGGDFACPIQTPVLPLGIDTEKFAALSAPDKRQKQRAALNVQEDEILILFVGRLNFLTKAHPLPLLMAVQKAAKCTNKKIRLVFYGYFFPQEEMERRFKNIVADYANNFTCEIITNDDPRFPSGLWAGADIFTSLVDNVQESFGLAPIEAMACGLPCVISDWDGYREGVRNGQDGFLIPTLTPPAETGQESALRYLHNHHYGLYLAGASQSTSIDSDAAAKAFALLANDNNRRSEMGQTARKRARDVFDWKIVMPSYEALWQKLAEARKTEITTPLPEAWPAASLTHINPFVLFEGFSSHTLSPDDLLQVISNQKEISTIFSHDMNLFAPDLLLPKELLLNLINVIETKGTIRIKELINATPPLQQDCLWRTLGWLLKTGICVKSNYEEKT